MGGVILMVKKTRQATYLRPRRFPGKKVGQGHSKQVKDYQGNGKDDGVETR
jgi:hypothetical protein